MKRIFSPLIIFGISAIFAISCSKEVMMDSANTFPRSCFATIIHDAGVNYLVADDSTLMKPMRTAGIPATFQAADNARVKITYTADYSSSAYPFEIFIKEIQMIPTGRIVTSSQPDTLSKGLIQPLNIWYSGGVFNTKRFITINFLYTYLKGFSPDQFNIILSESGKDDSGYYCFTMASKIISDDSGVTSFISFPLENRHTTPDVKGFKIWFYTFEKKYQEVTVDF